MLSQLPQNLVFGLLVGGLYGLAAVGLSLVFGVTKILNVSHGELLMLGGYAGFWMFTLYGVDPFIGLPLAILLLVLLGLLLYKGIFGRMTRLGEESKIKNTMLIGFGLTLIIQNVALLLWTADDRGISTVYSGQAFTLLGLRFPYVRVAGLVISLVCLFALHFFLRRTYMGKAIRATVVDWEAASLVGIDGLTASVTSLSVIVNKTSSLTAPNTVLDFANSAETINTTDTDAASRSIATGPTSSPVTLDVDGDEGVLLQVATDLTLDVFGFVQLDGSMAFKKATGSFVVTNGTTHASTALSNVSYLEIGAHVNTAFAGVGSIGFELTDVGFGMVMVSDTKGTVATTDDVNYMALKANVTSASHASFFSSGGMVPFMMVSFRMLAVMVPSEGECAEDDGWKEEFDPVTRAHAASGTSGVHTLP